MPRSNAWTDERGTASLEFITVGVLLLVPLVYLVLTLAALQAGALAVEGAARQAARVYVQAESVPDAAAAAERAVLFALADHGIDREQASVSIECSATSDCLTRRSHVTVTVRLTVPLPLLPPVLDLPARMSVPLEAQATQQVSRFWSAR
ncbi:hypothetical protein [Salinibacterium sp. ZJ450]|uniref:hypothetical protein n=1 Tax=Salinibacterium sp. ZJ450 TaxID=2708338 RepID=UPI00141FC2F2|nr:hypothetical protein [Salinibacterium sp. ZJ450]